MTEEQQISVEVVVAAPNDVTVSEVVNTVYVNEDSPTEVTVYTPGIQGASGPAGPAGPIGPTGSMGGQGIQGATGPAGPGIAAGGTTNDLLVKVSEGDYDTGWTSSPTVGSINFDVTEIAEPEIGELIWNESEGTLDLGMSSGVIQQVGMSFFMPPTKNNSGVTIPAGAFVMATGAQGDRLTIAKAVTNGSVDPMFMIGIAAQAIPNGSETGKVLVDGLVKGINTAQWPIGTILYPNPTTAGGLTATKPDAPAIRTPIAIVVRQQANTGRLLVRMSNGSTLGGTDSNVKFSNLQEGQIISWDATQNLWVNRNPDTSSEGGASFFTDLVVATTESDESNQTVDSTLADSIKYLIRATDGTNATTTEILANKIGATVDFVEYGTIQTGSTLASFSVSLSSSSIVLSVTPTTDTLVNYRVVKNVIVG
jgi:hypothetical protein